MKVIQTKGIDIKKTSLHKALLQLRKDYENHSLLCPYGGICVNLDYAEEELIKPLIALWPEYSGNISYPVPYNSCDPHKAYYVHSECLDSNAMWYEGEYAAARVRLLDFLIEQTK